MELALPWEDFQTTTYYFEGIVYKDDSGRSAFDSHLAGKALVIGGVLIVATILALPRNPVTGSLVDRLGAS